MTISEYVEMFLLSRTESMSDPIDEKATIEMSHLVSGSFVYPLYEHVTQADYEADAITNHLELSLLNEKVS